MTWTPVDLYWSSDIKVYFRIWLSCLPQASTDLKESKCVLVSFHLMGYLELFHVLVLVLFLIHYFIWDPPRVTTVFLVVIMSSFKRYFHFERSYRFSSKRETARSELKNKRRALGTRSQSTKRTLAHALVKQTAATNWAPSVLSARFPLRLFN